MASPGQQGISVDQMESRIRAQTVNGVTVVVHGWQFWDSGGAALMPLAKAIYNAIPGPGWLIFYDFTDDGLDAAFNNTHADVRNPDPNNPQAGHLVLLFGWAPESNEKSAGWTEAAGDALFALLIKFGFGQPPSGAFVPIHFIAHSFGCAVVSECVERLAKYNMPVDQVTYLDPHDFDQQISGYDTGMRQWTLGVPAGYGASVWSNVDFVDVYYQTRGNGSTLGMAAIPLGRPIPGSYNYWMTAELPNGNPYDIGDSDHSYIWHTFYLGTVLGQQPNGTHAPATAPNWNATGWSFSRFSGRNVARPGKVFFNPAPPAAPTQDHRHTPRQIANADGTPNDTGLAQLGLNAAQITNGGWDSAWNPLLPHNYDFSHQGKTFWTGGSMIPGWSHHGGDGHGYIGSENNGANHYITLRSGYVKRVHNRMYIPHDAVRLSFNLWRRSPSQDDTLDVYIGDRSSGLLGVFRMNGTDNNWTIKNVAIPAHLQGNVHTLTFELTTHNSTIESEAWVDNVRFNAPPPPVQRACVGPGVRINEFQYDDSGVDNQEFVELFNAGDSAVDVSGWILMAGDLDDFNDNNPDYTIPSGTILQPGQFYVIGAPTVPNVNLVVVHPTTNLPQNLWENDNEWLALVMPNDTIVDAVAWETNKGMDFPDEILMEIGTGVWGNYTSTDGESAGTDTTNQSISRWRDGCDSNLNGYDFGLMRRTPGEPNHVMDPPAFPMFDNFDSYNVGDMVPNWTGSFRNPRAIDPTQIDFFLINQNIVPASPGSGGNAMITWDWAGGGNQSATDYLFENAAGYECYVYIANDLLLSREMESWAIGVLGSSDTFYNLPFVGTSANPCGITGVAWVYHRDSTEVTLRLVDARDGGDSRENSPYWFIYPTIDLTHIEPGWYRLRLEVLDGVVRGVFDGTYGSPTDGTIVTSTTSRGLIGQVYTGYRETIAVNSSARPLVIDDLNIFVPLPGDANGDGCVDDQDLLLVLFAFGGTGGLEDLNGNGTVDDADLLLVLSNFGSGC